ncbi:hypothetical protein G9A89_000437 [Geosiphon pyriformis]|nr:hypothetical protein G9A89_000437 [Geosiphon pyriformis]
MLHKALGDPYHTHRSGADSQSLGIKKKPLLVVVLAQSFFVFLDGIAILGYGPQTPPPYAGGDWMEASSINKCWLPMGGVCDPVVHTHRSLSVVSLYSHDGTVETTNMTPNTPISVERLEALGDTPHTDRLEP